jgi:hypothetical protein
MKPAFAHFAPTVPVAFAAAMGIALSVFLLPGAGVQSEPTPLLAVIGGAAGRVAADLPARGKRHASEPVRSVAPVRPAATRPAATRTERLAPRRRQAGTKSRRAHHPARTRVVRAAPSVPVQAPPPTARAAPVTTRQFFSNPTSKGKSHGHAHAHARALKPTAATEAPTTHGHGKAKAIGHSRERHDGLPPGQAKKAPTAPPAAPTTPPKSNGNGNGHDRSGK